jgi:hypothetical protein
LAIKSIQGSSINNGRVLRSSATLSTQITQTLDPAWLPLATITSSDQKFSGLYRIDEAANFATVQFSTSTGTYHVDWGDATSSDVASGTVAYHEYNYSDSALNDTNGPVTFTDSGDLVSRTAHGYIDGNQITFYSITSTTGISVNTPYYVINSTANTFQISLTGGGSAIALTTNGSGALLPFKQAIVTVTCNTGGANFTSINLTNAHNQSGLGTAYNTGWLAIRYAGSFTTQTLIGSAPTSHSLVYADIVNCNVTSYNSLFLSAKGLVTASVNSSGTVTSATFMFQNCVNLINGPNLNLSSAINTTSMFQGCTSLLTVPLYDTRLVSTSTSMFQGCSNLTSVPLLNTASVTLATGMFSGCKSLTTVPLFNFSAVANASQMFLGCTSLTTVPLFNFSAVTNASSLFSGCTSLTSVPLFNFSAVANASSLFNGCIKLTTVPLFNFSLVTSLSSTFNGCTSLITVPLFNTANCLNFNQTFQGCTSLIAVPLLNMGLGTAFTQTFLNCTNLVYVPTFNLSSATVAIGMFQGCSSLQTIPAFNLSAITSAGNMLSINANTSVVKFSCTGIKFTFTVASAKLSSTELNAIYTNLTTVVSAQTITVSGNYGISGDTPAIATAKNWVVTGS